MREVWEMEINGDKVTLTRKIEGKAVETYAPVSKNKASVFVVAAIQGFQPPRNLLNLDKPVG